MSETVFENVVCVESLPVFESGVKKDIIHVVVRDGLKRRVYRDRDFYPYFYRENVSGSESTLWGTRAEKIVCRNKYDLKQRRISSGVFTYEDDVPYITRYMVDSVYDEKIKLSSNPRMFVIDIETDMSVDSVKVPRPITCLTVYDNLLDEYHSWMWRGDLDELKSEQFVDIVKSDGSVIDTVMYHLNSFSNEHDMMEDFLRYYMENYPDIISGWNSTSFDIPYIYNRLKKIGIDSNYLSQFRKSYYHEDSGQVRLYGHSFLDFLEVYKSAYYEEAPPDNTLDTVGQWFLGVSKLQNEGVGWLWRNDVNRLMRYNVQDVWLAVNLDKKLGFYQQSVEFQKAIPFPLNDINSESRIIDAALLYMWHKKLVLPSKRFNEKGSLMGAYIHPPVKGFYENVAILDLSSLYPSIFATFNISPEILSSKGSVVIHGFVDELRRNYIDLGLSEDPRLLSINEKSGVMSETVKFFLSKRFELKNERLKLDESDFRYDGLKRRETIFKIVGNSVYGVLSFTSFRMYNIILANVVTYIGRRVLKWSIDVVEKQGFHVIYGDTDSLFVNLGHMSEDEAIRISKDLTKKINESYRDFVKSFGLNLKHSIKGVDWRLSQDENYHLFHIDLEKIFDVFIMTDRKKKYVGHVFYKDGERVSKIYTKGFDSKKRDTPLPIREILKELYQMILYKSSREEISKFLKESLDNLFENNSLYDLGSARTLSTELSGYLRLPQHAKAAIYSNRYLGTHFERGDKPHVVFVSKVRKGLPFTDVIALDLNTDTSGFVIDKEKYLERWFLKKINLLLDIAGYGEDVFQRNLDEWVVS